MWRKVNLQGSQSNVYNVSEDFEYPIALAMTVHLRGCDGSKLCIRQSLNSN